MTVGAAIVLAAVLRAAPQAAQPEDPALRAAVERFYEMQEKEDVAGYLALWSSRGPRPTPAQLKYIFDSGDDKFSDIQITRATPAGDRMRLRVEVRRARTSPPRVAGDPPFVVNSLMRVSITYEKEDDEWKIIREGPAADDLASAVVDAGTQEQRDALLAAEPELIGPQLFSAFARMGGFASVQQDYRRALMIYEQVVEVARRGGFKKDEGEALQNVANSLYFLRRFPDALAAYERRLVLERERGDDAAVASALAGIATVRYSLAEYTDALAGYREALAIHEVLDDPAGIAFTSLSIGNIRYLQGDFQSAIAAFRRSLDLNRTMFNADGESRALEGLGRVYTAQGDYAAALDVFDSVLKDKRLQNSHGRLGTVAQSLGDVHFRLGNLDAARASFEQSRAHFEIQRDMPNVGRVLQAVALTELVAARFAQAEELYTRSGSICTAAEDRICSAAAVAGLGYAQAAQEKYWDAVKSYRKAAEEFGALNRREDAARSEVGLSQALLGAGDAAGAVQSAINARQTAMGIDADDVMWRAMTAEARAVRKNGDTARALGIARAAVTVLDRLEAAALDKPGSNLTIEAAAALTTFAVLQAETGDAAGAFATSERLRALDLRAGLATNERDISRGMTADERAEERTLAAQVLTALAQVTREKGLPKPDASRIAALEKPLTAATELRRAFLQRLFDRLPALRVWRGLAPPRGAADAAPLLDAPGSILLSFVLDDEDMLVLALTKEDTGVVVNAHVAAVKRRKIAGLVLALQQPAVLGDAVIWRQAASELTALVPEPIVSRLAAASQVILMPHDVLWRVPFDALPIGDGLLIDRAVVSLAGSLDSLIRSTEAPPGTADSLFGVGLPDLAASRTERIRQLAPGWILRARETVEREMKTVSSAYETDRATVIAGPGATEAQLRTRALDGAVLHIAAPFRITAASPLFSPILLSTGESAPVGESAVGSSSPAIPTDSKQDDGSIELREVMNLELRARVVVLSDGAATSMREGAAAADVVQWGWLSAGVPTLVLPRWGGAAQSGERVLGEFHQRLRKGAAPADALRAARLVVRGESATAAPVYWSGWMLIGAQ